MNTLKWAIVITLMTFGIVGNYYTDQSLLVRILFLLGITLVSIMVALQTNHGKQFLSFVRDSRLELKRVIWPSRQEVIQITSIVLLMVTILGVVLWGVDSILLRAIGWLTGYGA